MRALENITYDELQVGDYATFTQTLSEVNLVLFAATTDNAPSTLDLDSAKNAIFEENIGFGMWASHLISTAFAKVIPGPGSIYLDQTIKFHRSVELSDVLTVKLTVKETWQRPHRP